MTRPSQLITGLHSVRTALRHGADSVLEVWVDARRRDRRIRELIGLVKQAGIRLHQVDQEALEHLVPGTNHQGIAARTLAPVAKDEKSLQAFVEVLETPPFLLILDGVQDPHNLGACLRTADAVGVDAVITPKDRAAGLTPTACKVASGAAERVPFFQVTNLSRTLQWLQQQGIWLVGTAGEAEINLYQADLKGPVGMVMGGEEKGMRRLTREACDLLIRLPMKGTVESLNVSVAAGVTLYEALRQRTKAVQTSTK